MGFFVTVPYDKIILSKWNYSRPFGVNIIVRSSIVYYIQVTLIMSEEQAEYKTPFHSPNADLARRLMNHFSVCRPLMSNVELVEIRKHSDDIEAKWEAYGDSNDEDRYYEILDEESKTPHLDKQQASYEAFLDSVINNFPELNNVDRQHVSNMLNFYFEYYFGDGGSNASETAGIIHKLDKHLSSSNIVK